MDWDSRRNCQRERERSMLNFKSDPSKPAHEQVIANIFQGRSGSGLTAYPGDSEMSVNGTMTIQVHLIKPIYEKYHQSPVYALGLIFPDSTKGFVTEKI